MGRPFEVNAGVRQGCVLRPKKDSVVHHWAMVWWRTWAGGCLFGFDFGDGLPPPVGSRFADDILIFAGSSEERLTLLDKLIHFFGDASLKSNAENTVFFFFFPPAPFSTAVDIVGCA